MGKNSKPGKGGKINREIAPPVPTDFPDSNC